MKQYYIYAFVILAATSSSYHTAHSMSELTDTPVLTESDLLYFDTKNFLSDSDKVVKTLMNDGFKECNFKTPDNYTIHGLYLERPNALCTVICCAGFYPGKKEGIASIVKMAHNCNILLFDSRGHGKSDGTLLTSTIMGQYARHEYQDIIGAIQFCAASHKETPIYVWGVCAGAVHAAHALVQLTNQNKINQYPVCGFTFDSGWASLTKISRTVPCATAQRGAMMMFEYLYKTNNAHTIQNGVLFNYVADTTDVCLKLIHTTFAQWPFRWYESETNLFDKMHVIEIPTFFVHSYDDTYAPISDVRQLAASVKNSTYWWIEMPSKHACHHLKYKETYISKLNAHIQSCVAAYKKNECLL